VSEDCIPFPSYPKNIGGYEIVRTCGCCPEQYDVFKDGKQAAYLRLRHGFFRADVPDCGGETVFRGSPRGDGIFEDDERDMWLSAAIDAVDAYYKYKEAVNA
jgi:hypothetical protein